MHRQVLRDMPPEAELDGRPDGADLLLQRTLTRVRQEKARDARRRGRVVAMLSAVLLSAALAGGVVIGQELTREPAERVLAGGVANGARMTTTITPSEGWLRLRTVVDGVDRGEKCRLVVTDRAGRKFVAGGWVESNRGEAEGAALAGAVMVAAEDLRTISVVTVDGRVLVTSSI